MNWICKIRTEESHHDDYNLYYIFLDADEDESKWIDGFEEQYPDAYICHDYEHRCIISTNDYHNEKWGGSDYYKAGDMFVDDSPAPLHLFIPKGLKNYRISYGFNLKISDGDDIVLYHTYFEGECLVENFGQEFDLILKPATLPQQYPFIAPEIKTTKALKTTLLAPEIKSKYKILMVWPGFGFWAEDKSVNGYDYKLLNTEFEPVTLSEYITKKFKFPAFKKALPNGLALFTQHKFRSERFNSSPSYLVLVDMKSQKIRGRLAFERGDDWYEGGSCDTVGEYLCFVREENISLYSTQDFSLVGSWTLDSSIDWWKSKIKIVYPMLYITHDKSFFTINAQKNEIVEQKLLVADPWCDTFAFNPKLNLLAYYNSLGGKDNPDIGMVYWMDLSTGKSGTLATPEESSWQVEILDDGRLLLHATSGYSISNADRTELMLIEELQELLIMEKHTLVKRENTFEIWVDQPDTVLMVLV